MESGPFLHLEHDGKLLLVNSRGEGPQLPVKGRSEHSECEIRLPTIEEVENFGIEWDEKRRSVIRLGESSATVITGHPNIDWPSEWAWKDDIISDSSVHPIARESVYRSIHRLVAKIVIQNNEKMILMAKVKRGHFAGFWTLPGGYVDHDEHPRDGAIREAMEELGIEIEISNQNPSIISQNIFTDEGISFVSVTYLVDVGNTELNFKPKEDEIEEVEWFSCDEAMAQSVSWFDKTAIRKLS